MIFTQNYIRITKAMGISTQWILIFLTQQDKWRENQQLGKYQFKSNFSADLVYDKQKQPVLSPQVLIPPLQTISAGQQRVLNYEAAQL